MWTEEERWLRACGMTLHCSLGGSSAAALFWRCCDGEAERSAASLRFLPRTTA